jgi:hypothetical protein
MHFDRTMTSAKRCRLFFIVSLEHDALSDRSAMSDDKFSVLSQ